MSFAIGDKVVCVDDSGIHQHEYPRHIWPEKGSVYVVQETVRQFCFRDVTEDAIFVHGLFRICQYDGKDYPWGVRRFRKLDEVKAEARERYYASQPPTLNPQPVS